MKSRLVALTITCLVLAGCGNWVTGAQVMASIDRCKLNGGIKNFSVFISTEVVCINGAVFDVRYVED